MSEYFSIPPLEIIVDNFAGGGGVSTGVEIALGRSPDVALNHNREALAMHEANHPKTVHLCQNILKADPVAVCAGRPVGLAWFSPDCTHFSKAKGGKPRSRKIRALAWVMVEWAKAVRPRVMVLENVEEFQAWGPLLKDGTPCPLRKGTTFARFVAALRKLGYKVEWQELRACNYGAPTLRKRLFLVARCDGRPIIWPSPTHAKNPEPPLKPWRTAAECIDWSIPCPSIFLTKEEARRHKPRVKRPLVEASLRRIARGIDKFVINAAEPFIVPLTHQGGDRVESVTQPFNTITGAHRGERAVVVPHVTKFRKGSTGSAMNEPMHTITAGSHSPGVNPAGASVFGVVEAKLEVAGLVRVAHGEESTGSHSLNDPIGTMPCSNEFAVWTAFLTEHANASGQRNFPADEPMRTQCASVKGGHFALIAPTLVQTGYGERKGQAARVPGLDKPLGTVVAGGSKHALVSAFLAKHFSERGREVMGAPVDGPLHTITGQDHHAVVTSHLAKLYGTTTGQPHTEPMHTVTGSGNHIAEVRAFLIKYYGNQQTSSAALTDPMHTATTHDRIGLVVIEGTEYLIVDIGMRMLKPRELFAGQGFPRDYVIDPVVDGKPLPAEAQVRMCGNSVPPEIVAAIVGVNVPELSALAAAA